MSDCESNSDNGEGFVSNKITIQQSEVLSQQPQSRPSDYQPRTLASNGIISKEPVESYAMLFDYLAPFTQESRKDTVRKKRPSKLGTSITPDDLAADVDYQQVYSRNSPTAGQDADNEVSLRYITRYHNHDYKVLKVFEAQEVGEQDTANAEHSLQFTSRFQSGNLASAYRSRSEPHLYYLLLHNDTNTLGYNQWFYFGLLNARPGITYRFVILNFKKTFSYFKHGMEPIVFSLADAKTLGNGWSQNCKNVLYTSSPLAQEGQRYYSLSFDVSFQHESDYVTISSSMPYSYSRLMHNLAIFKQQAKQSELLWLMKTVAYTLANNQVPEITISKAKTDRHVPIGEEQSQPKKTILLIARQHPGETWASFILESMLDELSKQQTIAARQLLQHYDVKVYPMVNVDGVIYGNFRCDLAGSDLNRTWNNPSKLLQPQVYAIKKQIEQLQKERQVVASIDLHGHSKQMGIFAYSCKDENSECHKLPFILSKLTSLFCFESCTFGISRDKQKTARAVIFGITGSPNTVTVEASCFGYKDNGKAFAFTPKHMQTMATTLIRAMKGYFLKDAELAQIQQEVEARKTQLDKNDERKHEQSGSDSDPSGDEMAIEQKLVKILPVSFSVELGKRNKNRPKKNITSKRILKPRPRKIPKSTVASKLTGKSPSKTLTAERAVPPQDKQIVTKTDQMFSKMFKAQYRKVQSKQQSPALALEKVEESTRLRNDIEFSLKKLPFFANEKPISNPIKSMHPERNIPSLDRKEPTIHFDKTYSVYEAMCRPRLKSNYNVARRFGKIKDDLKTAEEQLPYLCILSENKKKQHLDKLKEKRDPPKETIKKFSLLLPNHFEAEQKGSNIFNTELLTKIWRENNQRYGKQLGKTRPVNQIEVMPK